jgi:hypothetical protein
MPFGMANGMPLGMVNGMSFGMVLHAVMAACRHAVILLTEQLGGAVDVGLGGSRAGTASSLHMTGLDVMIPLAAAVLANVAGRMSMHAKIVIQHGVLAQYRAGKNT